MAKEKKQKNFDLFFPKEIVRLTEEFFDTSFEADVEALKQGEKHPAHPMNDRMKQLTNTEEQCEPVGIDIPVLIKPEQAEPKAIVVLLGQDPLRRCKDVEKDKVLDYAFVGTPYRMHHTEGLPPTTTVYPKLIRCLLEHGLSVYLTDVRKYYPHTNKVSNAQKPDDDDLLVSELKCLGGPLILVLSGNEAQDFFDRINEEKLRDVVTIDHVIRIQHLSSRGATHEAKIEEVMKQIIAIKLQ